MPDVQGTELGWLPSCVWATATLIVSTENLPDWKQTLQSACIKELAKRNNENTWIELCYKELKTEEIKKLSAVDFLKRVKQNSIAYYTNKLEESCEMCR